MFDTKTHLDVIKHSKDRESFIESSNFQAFKIDDADGIAEYIGFKSNMIGKVDYFLENNHHIQLIELSDLKEISLNIKDIIEKINQENIKGTLKTKKRKEAWRKEAYDFVKKWNGSIAVIERLYRKAYQCGNDRKYIENDPKYSLLIVCKNGTDIKELDSFKDILNGMMNGAEAVKVCTTEKLESFVISII